MTLLSDLDNLSKVGRALWERYGTPEKLHNARRLRDQTTACAETVDAYPWRVIFEPTNTCNLRCEGCSTPSRDLPKGLLDPDEMERHLDELWPYLVQVNLFNGGEPFLHPRLPEIIQAIRNHGVGTHVHSNVNHLPPGLAERIIDSGLDFLVASIDGVTQDVYAQFRMGGSCERALKNLERIVNVREAKGVSSPRIIWRLLRFPHNAHQIDEATRLAREIGTDDFAVAPGHLHGQYWTSDGPKTPTAAAPASPPYCTDLYDFPVIHWNAALLPCCFACDNRFAWGDLKTSSWHEAFNEPPFRNARRLSAGHRGGDSPCAECSKIAQGGLVECP